MRNRRLAILVLIAAAAAAGPSSAFGSADSAEGGKEAARELPHWTRPLSELHVSNPFRAPADPYSSGHRGVDLRATVGAPLKAPRAGTIAFSGVVVDRGVVTIDHGDGFVTTLEPVTAALAQGTVVPAGAVVATVDLGGHADAGTVHFGLRLHGQYINPLLVIAEAPKPVLLPVLGAGD